MIFATDEIANTVFTSSQHMALKNRHEDLYTVFENLFLFLLTAKKKFKPADIISFNIIDILKKHPSIDSLLRSTKGNFNYSVSSARSLMVELGSIIPITLKASDARLAELDEEIKVLQAAKEEGSAIDENELTVFIEDARLIREALENKKPYVIKSTTSASINDINNMIATKIRSILQTISNHERIESTLHYSYTAGKDVTIDNMVKRYTRIHRTLGISHYSINGMLDSPSMEKKFESVVILTSSTANSLQRSKMLAFLFALHTASENIFMTFFDDDYYSIQFEDIDPSKTMLEFMSLSFQRRLTHGNDENMFRVGDDIIDMVVEIAQQKKSVLFILTDNEEPEFSDKNDTRYSTLVDKFSANNYPYIVTLTEPHDDEKPFTSCWNNFVEQLRGIEDGPTGSESGSE